MAFQAKVITIFLSSPSDVVRDKNQVMSAINAWNQRNGQQKGLLFNVITWENFVSPDIGDSGQDVINDQVGSNYDIFLGLMWSRFGTPTSDAKSGTADEFFQAIESHNSGDPVIISFLFNTSPIPQSILDGEQFANVQSFKKTVAEKGCLYREYADDTELLNSLILILDKFANKQLKGDTEPIKIIGAGQTISGGSGNAADDSGAQAESLQDFGILDLNEILEKESKLFVNLMTQWAEKLNEIGNITTISTDQLDVMSRFGKPDPQQAKNVIDRLANSINEMASWGESNIGEIEDSMDKFSNAYARVAIVSADFKESKEDIYSAVNSGLDLCNTVNETNNSFNDLINSITSMPRLSKHLNKSNRRLSNLLLRMINKNESFKSNCETGISELQRRLIIASA